MSITPNSALAFILVSSAVMLVTQSIVIFYLYRLILATAATGRLICVFIGLTYKEKTGRDIEKDLEK